MPIVRRVGGKLRLKYPSSSSTVAAGVKRALSSGGTGKITYNPVTKIYTDAYGNTYKTNLQGALSRFNKTVSNSRISYSSNLQGPDTIYTKSSSSSAPISTVEPVVKSTGLRGVSESLQKRREQLRTKELLRPSKRLTAAERLELYGATALSGTTDFVLGFIDLPKTLNEIRKDPTILKQVPSGIMKQGKEFGEIIDTTPGEAIVRIGTEVLLLKGLDKSTRVLGKAVESGSARFSTKYVGALKPGKKITIKTAEGTAKLDVVKKIPGETLKSQALKAGKTLDTAISTQADTLLSLIKRRRILRKPIPGEEAFTKATKRLLGKFDRGTITRKELSRLDTLIKKQGSKGLLERAFFADPSGKIRPSRLGLRKSEDVNLLDLLTEDLTFKKPKPQILLFQNVKIPKFPKSFNKIVSKLKRGVALTKKESDKLLNYQLKKSGKFKPVGFVSKESEITLAPGEIIKKIRKVGVTTANGRKVPIIQTGIYKPKGRIKTLLGKFYKGKLTKKEERLLDKLLKKETGFDYGVSSSKAISRKYVNIKKVGLSSLSKLKAKRIKPLSSAKSIKRSSPKSYKSPVKSPKRSSPRSSPISKKSPVKSSPRPSPVSPSYPKKSPPKSSPRSPPRSPPRAPPRGTPRAGRPFVPSSSTKRLKRKKIVRGKEAYVIQEKRGGKFVKLKGGALSLKDAKDRLAHRIDNKISRTARLVKVKTPRKLGSLKKKERGAFNKVKKNLRNYKIVKGKKIKTPLTFIEKKGKPLINTAGEKAQLKINRVRKKVLKRSR